MPSIHTIIVAAYIFGNLTVTVLKARTVYPASMNMPPGDWFYLAEIPEKMSQSFKAMPTRDQVQKVLPRS